MPWDRESDEEYDDGYTRESFERAEEDTPENAEPLPERFVVCVGMSAQMKIYGPFDSYDGADEFADRICSSEPVWVQQLED